MGVTYSLASHADTQKVAQMLAQKLQCGDVVTLAGDLGSGKTTFAQFLIQALSACPVEVTSPTFTLLQTYPVTLADGASCELYHFDLYRITHPSQLLELGIDDAVTQVAVIEWPERLEGMPIRIAHALHFAYAKGQRTLTWHALSVSSPQGAAS
jgi:tRNA threonylcarbamoyladenosine biosynthesis protein TsaE